MTKIINLNELVGEDIVFKYGQPVKNYRLPGDIDVDTVFELFQMFTTISEIKATDANEIVAEVKQKFDDITAQLLSLFQQRDPKLKSLPFGIRGTGVVLRTVLAELGVSVDQADPTPPPLNRAARRTPKRKTATRKRR